ncbi:MAG: winged helix-turn-helix domain-containing tetratricopeptide repeat protein [Silicimonas sp.]|nr:winged helix-turn-helix domain-containing tetratricopeptide repeat protein [Silicimonas sp.]
MNERQPISFLDFRLDPDRGELTRNGTAIAVEPQVLDLIGYLAANQKSIVSRDDLIEHVWQGRIVSDSAIASRINAARAALGDDGKSQGIIKTVPRRGFRFEPDTSHGAQPPQAILPERPSIVVLPFENLSGDPAQSFFSDGIADDIITDLSRYGELFVIARQSAFAFHDRKGDPYDFARELGVAYILEGSVRRSQDRVRVNAQLIDVASHTTLWAERFDREIADILDVQEEISTVIVNTLVGQVSLRHYRRVQNTGADAVSAYDHALRAQQTIWSFSRESSALVRREAEAAIRLDPGLARAHAILGWAYHTEGSNGWSTDRENPFDQAIKHSRGAIEADPNEPWGHCVLGFSLWWRDRGRDFGRGLEEIRLAVRLNPSNAHFRMIVGATFAYMGRGEEALQEIDAAIRFNPLYPGLYLVHRSRALFVSGRFEEALADSERAAVEMPMHANALALLAACYEKLGKHEQATAAIAELQQASANYTAGYARRNLPFAEQQHLDLFCGLLIDAGLPE